jgi:alpha-L-arabinofuranosidase
MTPGRTLSRRRRAVITVTTLLAGLLTVALPATAVPHTPQPLAHWAFDEGSGTAAHDSSGNGHTGTLVGAGWADGVVGPHSLAVTPLSSMDAPAGVVDTTRGFSVSAWVRLDSLAGYQTFVSVDGTNLSGFFLQLRADSGTFAFTVPTSDSTASGGAVAYAPWTPSTHVWYHLVGVDDQAEGQLRLYVNGLLQAVTPIAGTWRADGHTAVGRGFFNRGQVDWVDGQIDDVQLFQQALTSDQVCGHGHCAPAPATLTVDGAHTGPTVSPTLFGSFLEDISHSVEGGLYGELIQNRGMMAATTPDHWSAVTGGAGDAGITLDPGHPLNTALTRALALSITHTGPGARVGVANDGFWGIPVHPATTYTASFFAEASAPRRARLSVSVEGTDGTVYARGTVTGLGTSWHRYSVRLTTSRSAPDTSAARFVISTTDPALSGTTVWFDQVSLFPPTYLNRPNGLRVDLMNKLAALHPAFLRVPGGNYLEGQTVATRFDWKTTIGPTAQRPGHQDDAWGYWSTDGMGLLEYLTMAEELHATPVLAVWAGYTLNGTVVPPDQLGRYVRDAVDELQYATGPVTSYWGARRAADGHPAPFHIRYVEIGNEDFFDASGSYPQRYAAFYDALHAAYPALGFIATTQVSTRPYDLLDEHFYAPPAWFDANSTHYDTYPRSAPDVFVGEFASQSGVPTSDLGAALGDASWLTGLERNSDVVRMESYAPLLVDVNDVTWPTNMIGFDASTSFVSPSYYVQQLLARLHGDVVIGTSTSGGDSAGTGKATGTGTTLRTVATRDSRTGTVYVTVVNPSPLALPTSVRLTGVGRPGRTATVTQLTGTSAADVNSIADPNHVRPVTRTVRDLGTSFRYRVPAYSMTVFTIPTH